MVRQWVQCHTHSALYIFVHEIVELCLHVLGDYSACMNVPATDNPSILIPKLEELDERTSPPDPSRRHPDLPLRFSARADGCRRLGRTCPRQSLSPTQARGARRENKSSRPKPSSRSLRERAENRSGARRGSGHFLKTRRISSRDLENHKKLVWWSPYSPGPAARPPTAGPAAPLSPGGQL